MHRIHCIHCTQNTPIGNRTRIQGLEDLDAIHYTIRVYEMEREGFEPSFSGSSDQRLNQLGYLSINAASGI
jgi:hypothetical protein